MAVPKFLTRIAGIISSVSATQIGGTTAYANMLVATGANGLIDSSFGGGGSGSGATAFSQLTDVDETTVAPVLGNHLLFNANNKWAPAPYLPMTGVISTGNSPGNYVIA